MNRTPIVLDRLGAALAAQGVRLKRTQLLQVAASAFGYRNVHELAAADHDLAPPRPSFLGSTYVTHVGEMLFFQEPEGYVYGVDPRHLAEAGGRGADWVLSPFGGLADISEARGRLVPQDDRPGPSAKADPEVPYLLTDSDCEHVHGRRQDQAALGHAYGTFENDFYPLTEDESRYVDSGTLLSSDRTHEARMGYSVHWRGEKHLMPTVEFQSGDDYGTTAEEAAAEASAYAEKIRPRVRALGGEVLVEPDAGDVYGDPASVVRILVPMRSAVALGGPEAWRAALASIMDDPEAAAAEYPEIRVEGDEFAVTLEYIGEGEDGNYDPLDPDDRPLYRFDVQRREDGSWEYVEDTSYCTQVAADIGREKAESVARYLLKMVETHGGSSLKRLCERLSWTTIEDVENDMAHASA